MQNHPSLFLSDGKRSIDYVLVYKESKMTEENKFKLEYFLDSVLRTGIDFEIEPSTEKGSTIFVKLHAPKEIIIRYSSICDIDLAYRSNYYRPTVQPSFRSFATPLTSPNPEDEVYQRAPDTVSGQLPKDVTTSEKIMVLNKILNRTRYGFRYSDYGLEKLLRTRTFIDAFPLHEGPYQWTNSGPLTDRQLLSKFWGSFKYCYKEQPLNLIEKYYGTEVAFYFAWLGFYLKMLLPAGLLGVACFLYGVLTMQNSSYNLDSDEICSSDILMCPRCHYQQCKYEKLSHSCTQSYITYVNDNPATMVLAVIIAFWSTIFIELWKRKRAVLQIQWNVNFLVHDTSLRPEYVEAANLKKYSVITREYEPYITSTSRFARYILTSASIFLMLMIMIFATFGVMAYRITVVLMLVKDIEDEIAQKNTQMLASVSGSIISTVFIILFGMVYQKIALWLTRIESHRTQYEFDNSYIYKSYALAFTNNYSALFYIAFLKGKFYTHPGDMTLWSSFGGVGSDICGPTGCVMDLSLQLLSIMLMKIFVFSIVQVVVPIIKELFKRKLYKIKNKDVPLYGKEYYLLVCTDRYFLMPEYMDMVIQYGFIVFFVAGFPLAPFLALINTFIEIRVDSSKITRSFRRPVPRKVAGLGAWFGILQAITYVGVVTNAVVIAFTSNYLLKAIYNSQIDPDLQGFINISLSAFPIKDFAISRNLRTQEPICYYPGRRHPPDHPQKYQPTTDYWVILAIRFLIVVIFQHVLIFSKAILAYVIPDVPKHVTEELAVQERKNREARMKVVNDEFVSQLMDSGFSNVVKPLDID